MADAGTFYKALVIQVVPNDDGSSKVQFDPGASEGRFDETARAEIRANDPGKNAILATLLTSMVLGWEVTIELNSVPSYDNVQPIQAVGLVGQ